MMRRQPPPCRAVLRWLDALLRKEGVKNATAPLTGQDTSALETFVHALELYAAADARGRTHAVQAMAACAFAMQHSTRHLAKRAIPFVLDWKDEDRLWAEIARYYNHAGALKHA